MAAEVEHDKALEMAASAEGSRSNIQTFYSVKFPNFTKKEVLIEATQCKDWQNMRQQGK